MLGRLHLAILGQIGKEFQQLPALLTVSAFGTQNIFHAVFPIRKFVGVCESYGCVKLGARRSGERLFCPQLQVEAGFDLRRVTGWQHSRGSGDCERHTFQHSRLEE